MVRRLPDQRRRTRGLLGLNFNTPLTLATLDGTIAILPDRVSDFVFLAVERIPKHTDVLNPVDEILELDVEHH